MTVSIAILFLLIIGMIIVMINEWLPVDALALMVMTILIISGFVTPAEGLSGFSNEATITILAIMILTVGLETTGVISGLAKKMRKIIVGAEWKMLFFIMLISGFFSAFVSTTAVVIVFMRVLIDIIPSTNSSLSRTLMPLSFAGILGGSCTLLGTSTNLLVSSMAHDAGLKGFGVFEFSEAGLVFFAIGLVYMILIGRRLLPKKKKEMSELTEEYTIKGYLTELVIPEGSKYINMSLVDIPILNGDDIDVLEVNRIGTRFFPISMSTLMKGDILLIKSSVERLAAIRKDPSFQLPLQQDTMNDARIESPDVTLLEVIVTGYSGLVGKSLDKDRLIKEYGAIVLAVKKAQRAFYFRLDRLKIAPGDTILMEVQKNLVQDLYDRPGLAIIEEYEGLAAKPQKRILATTIMVLVIALASLGILSILESSLLGCVAMILTGCVDLRKSYRSIEWSVIFLIAGFIPLGKAMENTGASDFIANTFVHYFGSVTPTVLVGALYLFATLLSAVISNNATAILFTPIALGIASSLSLDPKPLLLTIMFASNMSFMSPVGYQTNTLIYQVGEYKFKDFIVVGGLLSLIIWITAIWLIPYLYF